MTMSFSEEIQDRVASRRGSTLHIAYKQRACYSLRSDAISVYKGSLTSALPRLYLSPNSFELELLLQPNLGGL